MILQQEEVYSILSLPLLLKFLRYVKEKNQKTEQRPTQKSLQ